ncbi:MAG: A24 family peptidase [Oscillospiraceae bacterium]
MVIPLLLLSSVIDYKTHTIPHSVCILLVICGIIKALIYNVSVLFPLLSGLITFIFLFVSAIIFEAITKKYLLGGGDIKLIAALSCYSGIYHCCYIMLFSMIIFILYVVITRQPKDKLIALCPFIFCGYVLNLLFEFWR